MSCPATTFTACTMQPWKTPVGTRASIRSKLRITPQATSKQIVVGEQIPNVLLTFFDSDDKLQEKDSHELLGGKKVAMVGVPGAFLPTCSMLHIPSFMQHADEFKQKGIEQLVCVSVNDVFVMDAWGKSLAANDILMVADGNAELALAMGVELDLTSKSLGIRSRRYSMILNDLKVEVLNLEEGGAYAVSSAEELLTNLE